MSEIYWDTKSVEWWDGVAQVDSPLIRLAVSILKHRGVYSVLDVGCGVGAYRNILSFPRYYGVDIAARAIEEAKKRFPKNEFFVGDFRHIQLPEVDAIAIFNVLGHLSSYEQALEKLFDTSQLVVAIFVKKLNEDSSQIVERGTYCDNTYSKSEISQFCESRNWSVDFFDGVRKIKKGKPIVSTLAHFYKNDSGVKDEEFYAAQAQRSKPVEYLGSVKRLEGGAKQFLKFLKKAGFEQPKILDAGCRDGQLVGRHENVIIGVECVSEVVDYARTKGRNIVLGDLDKLPHTNPNLFKIKFEGVFMSHSLEHVRDIQRVLVHLQKLLVVKGMIYIIVPDKPIVSHNSSHTTTIPFAEKLLSFLPLGLKLIYFYHNTKKKEIIAIIQKYRV